MQFRKNRVMPLVICDLKNHTSHIGFCAFARGGEIHRGSPYMSLKTNRATSRMHKGQPTHRVSKLIHHTPQSSVLLNRTGRSAHF